MLGMTSGADWLIAGLGNPEPKYDGTRHNAGFEALDYLAAQWHCDIAKAKWQGLYGTAQVGDHKVVLLKPLTYMNLSGQSIAPAANFYKIPADHVIVLCDDITQEPGHLRIRPHGSAGGHNGLKSIIASLGTENFSRIRIGIGAKPNPQYDLAAWVLGKLPPADRKAMTDRYPDIEDACKLLMDGNLQYAQNKFHHRVFLFADHRQAGRHIFFGKLQCRQPALRKRQRGGRYSRIYRACGIYRAGAHPRTDAGAHPGAGPGQL